MEEGQNKQVSRISKSMPADDDSDRNGLNESFASMQQAGLSSQNNLSSIVNIPVSRTAQMLDGFRDMITSTRIFKSIEDKSGWMFSKQGSTYPQEIVLSKETLSKINVDVADFSEYRERISKELGEYLRQKRLDAQSVDLLQTVDLHQILVRCYEVVPSIYFEEKFQFDFKSQLSREISKMNDTQEVLSGYLDEVEINLFYQISNRFNEFLKVILDLNNMQKLIDECLGKIAFVRTRNLVLKQKLAQNGSQIVGLKKRILRFQSVLALLQLAQTLHESIPSIASLVNAGKFDLAVNLLHQSEIEYNSKFQKMLSLNQFRDQIFLYRQKLEKGISTSFMDQALDYVISELSFNKGKPAAEPTRKDSAHSNDNSFEDTSSYINSTILNDTFDTNHANLNLTVLEKASRLSHLSWQLPLFRRDLEVEEQISRIVNQSYDLDKFNNQAYRRKLIEMLKGFREGFINDMTDYNGISGNRQGILSDINGETTQKSENTQGIFQGMNVELFVKFVLFYSEILKRVAVKQMGLTQTLLNSLISHVIETMAASEVRFDEQINALMKLANGLDDVYQNVVQLFKYFDDWLGNLLQQRRLDEEASIPHFRKISKIFQFWMDFQKFEAPKLLSLNIEKFEQIPQCKESKEFKKIFRRFGDYHLKAVVFKSLEGLRSEMERKFLDSFHKSTLAKLKASLDADKWVPADVSFEFYDILNYLLTIPQQQGATEKDLPDGSDKPEVSDDDSVLSMTKEELAGDQVKEAESNSSGCLKIIKNQIIANGETYKVSSAFLILLRALFEYLHLLEYFPTLRGSSATKIYELLRFYNSYALKLTLGKGACDSGQQITSKNLALSSLCLLFSLAIFIPLHDRLRQFLSSDTSAMEQLNDNMNRLTEDYTTHNSQIVKTISSILSETIKAANSSLIELPWNNVKENLRTPTVQTSGILKSFRLLYSVLLEFYQKAQISLIYQIPLDNLLKIFLPILSTISLTNKLGAKRLKDEIDYCVEEIKNEDYAKLDQDFLKQFEEAAEDIIQERCMPLLAQNSQNSSDQGISSSSASS